MARGWAGRAQSSASQASDEAAHLTLLLVAPGLVGSDAVLWRPQLAVPGVLLPRALGRKLLTRASSSRPCANWASISAAL
jgi:hypothetical protein